MSLFRFQLYYTTVIIAFLLAILQHQVVCAAASLSDQEEDLLFGRNGLPIDHVQEMYPDDYSLEDYDPPFDVDFDLEVGEVSQIYWSEDVGGGLVDEDARMVGLPPELTVELRAYCEEIGLMDVFYETIYEKNYYDDETEESSSLKSGTSAVLGDDDLREDHAYRWAVRRADFGREYMDNDLHWIDALDEVAFEKTMRVLERGHLDLVLDGLAEEFEPDGYMIAGVGFMVVSHAQGSQIHSDNAGMEQPHDFLHLVVPLVLPEEYDAALMIGNEEDFKVAPFVMEYDRGLLISAQTKHATADCDYRRTNEFRVFASIYVVDINENNAADVADDGTALFPVPHHTDWLLSQKGRFWGGPNGGTLWGDLGRNGAFVVEDELEECPRLAEEGRCLPGDGEMAVYEHDNDEDEDDNIEDLGPWQIRKKCLRSCGVFIDEEEYLYWFLENLQEDFEEEGAKLNQKMEMLKQELQDNQGNLESLDAVLDKAQREAIDLVHELENLVSDGTTTTTENEGVDVAKRTGLGAKAAKTNKQEKYFHNFLSSHDLFELKSKN